MDTQDGKWEFFSFHGYGLWDMGFTLAWDYGVFSSLEGRMGHGNVCMSDGSDHT